MRLAVLARLKNLESRRCRRHSLLQGAGADEGIDKRTLAGVELSDYPQQEQTVELCDGPFERQQFLTRYVEPGKGDLKPAQPLAFIGELLARTVFQQGREHARQNSKNDARKGLRDSEVTQIQPKSLLRQPDQPA